MFGNIKEAYLLHICHGFSTMVSPSECNERMEVLRVELIIQYYNIRHNIKIYN